MLKYTYLLILVFTSMTTVALQEKDFSFTSVDAEYKIQYNPSGEFLQVENVGGGGHQITKIFDHQSLKIIVYYAGSVGTRSSTDYFNAVIFNPETKKFIGEILYDIEGEDLAKKISLRIEGKKVLYTNPLTEEKTEFKLK